MSPLSASAAGAREISRRDALKHLSAGALLASVWPGPLAASAPAGSFSFATINDTHYKTAACGAWLRKVVDRVREERPDFCLHMGDLVDTGDRACFAAVRDLFGRLGVPAYPVPGNHDYTEAESLREYEESFPGRTNYTFEHAGWQFIGLDTTEKLLWHDTRISAATMTWVDELLSGLDRERPLVVFTHFPLIIDFPLIPAGAPANIRMQPVNAAALLEKFRGFNLQGVLTGHFHGFAEQSSGAATIATHRCCGWVVDNHDGTTEKGFMIYTASAGRLSRRFCAVS
ncbi:MAG: metallophosphoesterase [Opitutaceae bacterium]|nr:metallophosphoesterase [Opitutaceae bacterium]